ncbi:MAG: chorismate mutase [Acidimicrobiales bacterium]
MPGPPSVRALRGATTVEADTVEQVTARVQELMTEVMARNDLLEEDIISVIFTATSDIVSMFPATAARGIGFGAVPLLCASEIPVPGATPLCIRVLAHVTTTLDREELRHVYLHGAQVLRDDLPV